MAALALRLALGFGMAFHGYPKLFDRAAHDQFAQGLLGMGVPVPELTAWALALLEFGGGLFVLLGVLTAFLSALFVIEMAFAIVLVHLPFGFEAGNVVGTDDQGMPVFGMPGYEVNVLYIAGFLALLFIGAGRYSLAGLVHRPPPDVGTTELPRLPRSPFADRGRPWRRRGRRTAETRVLTSDNTSDGKE
jgi:putative oxidoreductase